MTEEKLERMLDLITELVDEDGGWRLKKDRLLTKSKESGPWNVALGELIFWFTEEDFK
jgi:hypothetical protein